MNEPNQSPEPIQENLPVTQTEEQPKPLQKEPSKLSLWLGKFQFQLRRNRRYLCWILAAVVIACLGYGVFLYRSANEFKSLSNLKEQTTETDPSVQTQIVEELPQEKMILPQFQELAATNPDFFGWLTIADTRIDYPVMHTPDEPEKYLYANFNGEYRFSGTPFLDAACSADSDNLIIHAHNMLDGSMFRSLLNYESKSYWEAHPTIQFSTLYQEGEYEILAAFRDRVYYEDETFFKFYNFIDATDEADFDYAMKNFAEKALYDTGVTASYGDQLLTLTTCAYHTENGRFVVVARRKG